MSAPSIDPLFNPVTDAVSGSLGADVRTVVLVGITICLCIVGLRYVLGLFGVHISKPKEYEDDD